MNKLILVGNLTKDVDERRTQNGKATTELCGQYFSKGSKILVEGRLKMEKNESRKINNDVGRFSRIV